MLLESFRKEVLHANQEIAASAARGQLYYYELLERRGQLRRIRTATELDAHWQSWPDSWVTGQPRDPRCAAPRRAA